MTVGKEKQYPLQEKLNKWPSPKLLGATILPNTYINKYNGYLLLIAGEKKKVETNRSEVVNVLNVKIARNKSCIPKI